MFTLFTRAMAEEVLPEVTPAVEAVAEAEPGWFEAALARFSDLGATGWITIVTLLVLAAVMILMSVTRKAWTARTLAYAAMCIALSFILSYIKVFEMPQGGSVTLASMLPIMLFSAVHGVGPGMLVGAVYGLLQYIQGGWFVHPIQFLLDYPLAFAMIGLAGLYTVLPKEWSKWSLYAAMVIAAVGRAFSATLAGILYWDTAPWASLVYNGTYLIPDTIICIVIAIFVGKRLLKMMRR